MTKLRLILLAMSIGIIAMTIAAVGNEGLNLILPFLSPILALSWQGQFNVDFSCYLVLSGIWMAWRSGFTKPGIALGVLAPPLGILFFAPYLIYLISQCADPKRMLLGVHADPA